MDLNEIVVFAKVVEAGSFVGAARTLALPKSTVSRRVAELEARLGARLLQRTTRKLSLTDVGHLFYAHAERIAFELAAAELAVSEQQASPRGLLRVAAPMNFHAIGPLVASFLAAHPAVQVELWCSDRLVDLVREGFDIAIRAGRLADSTLVARLLGTIETHLVASSILLAAHGTPHRVEDLARYPCLLFGEGPERTTWRLERGGRSTVVQVKGSLATNDHELLREAAIAGLGVARLPGNLSVPDVREGRLVRLLPEWTSGAVPLHAVYPSSRHPAPKLTAFLDHLLQHAASAPWQPPR